MGTISDKLTYLNTTKSQLKDMINYGLDDENKITSSTTFREYVSSIFNAFLEALRTPDTLFNNLPKKSGSGSVISLNDTANAPMRIELSASELTQDATPTPSSPQAVHTISGSNKVVACGKNLFDKSKAVSNYRLDSTGNLFANDDYFTSDFIEVKPNTIYRTNIEPTIYKRICEYNSSKTFLTNKDNPNTNYITTSPTTKFIKVAGLLTELDSTMVYEGSTFLTYEPYISQEADIDLGLNLFNATTTNVGKYLDGSGNLQTSSASNTTDYIEVEENNIYTLSYDYTTLASSGTRQICFYNSSKTFITSRILQYGATDKTNSFMSIPNAKYMRITYDKNCNNISVFKGTLTPIEYCKIGNYENKFIRTSGKNLFDKNNLNLLTDYYVDSSAKIVSGTANKLCWVKLEPNTTYTLTQSLKINATVRIGLFDTQPVANATGTLLGTFSGTSAITQTFTTTSTAVYLAWVYVNTNYLGSYTEQQYLDSIMLNLGSTALDYEPYGSNEWYLKKNIGKVVLDGTQGTISTPSTNRFNIDNALQDYVRSVGNKTYMCNGYDAYNQTATNGDFNNLVSSVSYGFNFTSGNSNTIRFKDTRYTTTTDFQNSLASNNAIIYYVLSTPTYTQITGTLAEQLENVYKNMLSQKGTTNISQVNNDLPFIMNVSAIEV